MPNNTPKTILVIEDDPIVAMIVEDVLIDMGIGVLISATLENALLDIEAVNFDAAIVDMYLRGESALAAIDLLLEQKLPFMVLSGTGQHAFRQQYPQVPTMAKPFEKHDLEQAIRQLLDSSRAASAGSCCEKADDTA
jgi:CheY-like chemotaxis protein